jgi:hypothetical protein
MNSEYKVCDLLYRLVNLTDEKTACGINNLAEFANDFASQNKDVCLKKSQQKKEVAKLVMKNVNDTKRKQDERDEEEHEKALHRIALTGKSGKSDKTLSPVLAPADSSLPISYHDFDIDEGGDDEGDDDKATTANEPSGSAGPVSNTLAVMGKVVQGGVNMGKAVVDMVGGGSDNHSANKKLKTDTKEKKRIAHMKTWSWEAFGDFESDMHWKVTINGTTLFYDSAPLSQRTIQYYQQGDGHWHGPKDDAHREQLEGIDYSPTGSV